MVTDFSYYFTNGNHDVSELRTLDTTYATNMSHMFDGCENLPTGVDLRHFETSNVTDMSYMFANSEIRHIYINWNTSKVQNMESMFKVYPEKGSGLDDLSYDKPMNMSNVTNISNMFEYCNLREIDISTFKFGKMYYAFANCANLSYIDMSGIKIPADFYDMVMNNQLCMDGYDYSIEQFEEVVNDVYRKEDFIQNWGEEGENYITIYNYFGGMFANSNFTTFSSEKAKIKTTPKMYDIIQQYPYLIFGDSSYVFYSEDYIEWEIVDEIDDIINDTTNNKMNTIKSFNVNSSDVKHINADADNAGLMSNEDYILLHSLHEGKIPDAIVDLADVRQSISNISTKVDKFETSFGKYLPLTGGTLTGDLHANYLYTTHIRPNGTAENRVLISDDGRSKIDLCNSYINIQSAGELYLGPHTNAAKRQITMAANSIYIWDNSLNKAMMSITPTKTTAYSDIIAEADVNVSNNISIGGIINAHRIIANNDASSIQIISDRLTLRNTDILIQPDYIYYGTGSNREIFYFNDIQNICNKAVQIDSSNKHRHNFSEIDNTDNIVNVTIPTTTPTIGTAATTLATINGNKIQAKISAPTDTKNTAGSSSSTGKLYIIGAPTLSTTGVTTYSNSGAYVSAGKLYSNSLEVATKSDLNSYPTNTSIVNNYVKNSSLTANYLKLSGGDLTGGLSIDGALSLKNSRKIQSANSTSPMYIEFFNPTATPQLNICSSTMSLLADKQLTLRTPNIFIWPHPDLSPFSFASIANSDITLRRALRIYDPVSNSSYGIIYFDNDKKSYLKFDGSKFIFSHPVYHASTLLGFDIGDYLSCSVDIADYNSMITGNLLTGGGHDLNVKCTLSLNNQASRGDAVTITRILISGYSTNLLSEEKEIYLAPGDTVVLQDTLQVPDSVVVNTSSTVTVYYKYTNKRGTTTTKTARRTVVIKTTSFDTSFIPKQEDYEIKIPSITVTPPNVQHTGYKYEYSVPIKSNIDNLSIKTLTLEFYENGINGALYDAKNITINQTIKKDESTTLTGSFYNSTFNDGYMKAYINSKSTIYNRCNISSVEIS